MRALNVKSVDIGFIQNVQNITDNEYDVFTTHQTGTIYWYCENCNNKSVHMLQLVFGLQDRLQKVESDLGSIRN